MKRKKFAICVIVILAILIVGALSFGFMFFGGFGGLNFLLHVPKPEIKYGEFPFHLTYELNGEIKTVDDTIICEFDGFETLGEAGKYRKWKTRLKSGSERITLLNLRELNETNEFGQTMLELFFSYGNAEYYMGDEFEHRKRKGEISNWVEYMYQTPEGTIGGSAYKADKAWEKYKIKLISWEPSPPIKNTFK